jgi:hypothetical protein
VKLLLALLSVVFFQFVFFDLPGVGNMALVVLPFVRPEAGMLMGVPLAMMAGPCFGRQTPFKKWLCLAGILILYSAWIVLMLLSRDRWGTFGSGILFLAASLPLLILRLREDFEKEAVRLRGEDAKMEQIRSALAKKPTSLP